MDCSNLVVRKASFRFKQNLLSWNGVRRWVLRREKVHSNPDIMSCCRECFSMRTRFAEKRLTGQNLIYCMPNPHYSGLFRNGAKQTFVLDFMDGSVNIYES